MGLQLSWVSICIKSAGKRHVHVHLVHVQKNFLLKDLKKGIKSRKNALFSLPIFTGEEKIFTGEIVENFSVNLPAELDKIHIFCIAIQILVTCPKMYRATDTRYFAKNVSQYSILDTPC